MRKSCWLLPRKVGKSQLAAACLIYCLCTFSPGQQVYSVARDRAQASEIFKIAAQMLRQDPELMEAFGIEIVDSQSRIVIPAKHSFFAAVSREHRGNKLGKNPSVIFFDEAQELDEKMHAAMITGMQSRSEPLIIYCMTGGEKREGIGYEMAEYGKKVEAGVITDPTFLPVLYYAKDEEEEHWDQEWLWKRVIPAIGDFISLDYIREMAEQAKHLPRLQADFKRFYLNLWQSPSHSWIKDIDWMGNAKEPLGCDSYVAGLDVASVNDTSSLVLFGRSLEGSYDIKPYIWVCERQVRERSTDEASYPLWHREGHLRVTPGECQSQPHILADIKHIFATHHITRLGVDAWGMQWLGPTLLDEFPDIEILAVDQSMRFISEPVKQMERLILNKQCRHGGHPVMRWMASNARVVKDHSENVRLDKRNSERMDAIQALANAVSLWDFRTDTGTPRRSVYEERGLLRV